MLCNYPAHRRPACIALKPIQSDWLKPSECHMSAHDEQSTYDHHGPDLLMPITATSDCPSQLSPFSPITPLRRENSPVSSMANELSYSPITVRSGYIEMASPITEVPRPKSRELLSYSPITPMVPNMSPVTPDNRYMNAPLVKGNLNSKIFIGIMPGCPACKQLMKTVREDGIEPATLDTTTREGKDTFKQITGFEWMYPTYPQLFIFTDKGLYRAGGNRDYQNMRSSLLRCDLASDPDADCLAESGVQRA